ncbi:hypothetical protein BHM03_00042499 [Ensete ventricosum]|nr:hypothetical protein BHM03_00042499 [Ensete ventricosum]
MGRKPKERSRLPTTDAVSLLQLSCDGASQGFEETEGAYVDQNRDRQRGRRVDRETPPSAIRALAPPVYPIGYLRRVGHVGGPAVRGCDDLAARSAFVISDSIGCRAIVIRSHKNLREPHDSIS